MAKAEQFWRVFTSEGTSVISTLWNPTPSDRKVIASLDSAEEAAGLAVLCQQEYDTIRKALEPV
jgi:hypothetical protein